MRRQTSLGEEELSFSHQEGRQRKLAFFKGGEREKREDTLRVLHNEGTTALG
jgi:hypothetical protein